MLALALPALGMKLGESGADSLPRSIPVMRTYDAMTAAFPQTGFAHTVAMWSDDSQPLDKAAVRQGVAATGRRRRAQRALRRPGRRPHRLRTDGRTATVDLAMTGDFNTDRSKQSLALLRDDLVPALQRPAAGRRGAVTGDTAGLGRLHRDVAGAPAARLRLRARSDLPGAGARIPVGRRRRHCGGAEPAVGRRGVRSAGADLPARFGRRPARASSRAASSSTGCRCSCS